MWDEQLPVQSLHSAIKKAVEEDTAKQKPVVTSGKCKPAVHDLKQQYPCWD